MTHIWFLVGEMRVGEMRVGEMRAGKMRVGLELEVTIDWFAETTVHTQHRLKETNSVRTSSILMLATDAATALSTVFK